MFLQHTSGDVIPAHSGCTRLADAPPHSVDAVTPLTAPSGTALPRSTTPDARQNACDATAYNSVYTKAPGSMQHPAAPCGGAAGSAASSPVQQNVLSQQGLHGSVAAAAAMHYKQQQAKLAGVAMNGHGATAVAALHGLQDQQSVDTHKVISSTAPSAGAPTAVFTYASSPQAKSALMNGSVARQPAALPGVSSLYGRLRSSALGPGAAAAASTGAAAAAAAAAAGINIGPQAATGVPFTGSRCHVVSQPQLWSAVGDSAAGSAATGGRTAADNSADYLSLLMAATNLSTADAAAGSQTIGAEQRLCLLQQQLQQQQQQGTPLSVSTQSTATQLGLGPNSTTACSAGLPPTPPGLMSQQLPAQQQQQMLLAGLSGSAAAALSQEQLLLLQGNAGGLLYNNTAGLSGLQQYAQGATPELMYNNTASNLPGLTLNGGTSGLTSTLTAFKMDHAMAGAGGVHKPEGAHNPLYKTELCRTWSETGSCRYGARCQFAHGQVELRAVVRPPKYKTQPCRTYSLTGKCPYGARCNFIHDGEDDETVISRNRAESAAAAAVNSTALSLARASSNGGPASVSSATGAFYGATSVLGADAAAAGAGLFSSLANSKVELGSLPNGWNSLLAADDGNGGSINGLGLGAGNGINGLSGQAAVNGLCTLGLGGLGVRATDTAPGVNFATCNGVVGLNQMQNGMVGGNGTSVATLGQYGLLSNMANAQLGLNGIGNAAGFMGDNFSQII